MSEEDAPDMVNNPPHYKAGDIECITVIEQLELGYRLGTALKYLWRHKKKGKPLEDLRKMQWFLNREIAMLEKAGK